MAVGDENIDPTVVVEVDETYAPAQEAGILAEAGLKGFILEDQIALVVVETRRIAGEVGLDYVEIAVAIVVGSRHAHSRLRFAVRAIGDTRLDGHVGESAVVI